MPAETEKCPEMSASERLSCPAVLLDRIDKNTGAPIHNGQVSRDFKLRAYPCVEALELDVDVHAGGKVEAHDAVNHGSGRIENVNQTLVRAHLELLA